MKYPHLFSPVAIGDTVFRNRIMASPQGFYNVAKDNLPSAQEAAFFERKAVGGFASVTVGDCIVDSATGTHYPFLIRMDDPATLPGLHAVADAVTRHGAVASAELSHAGMYARFVKDPDGELYGPEAAKLGAVNAGSGGTLYGPVAIAQGKYGEVEEMPEELIEHLIYKFGKAAAWAKRAGFNMVTIHGGHGWLLAQFMSPQINTRTDKWGGTFENRMRFPLAAVESVRRAVGNRFPIEIRISGSECDDGGYDIDEGVAIAKALDGKVDILHVSAGNHESDTAFLVTHPSLFAPDGTNVRFAAEIKKHVKSSYVATVGAICEPEQMEEIIASGKADFVALGRQSIADPDLPRKARSGREADINLCLRCCTCFAGAGAFRTLQCATNPEIGHELEAKITPAATGKKRVLVVGGGVGGMQAALTAKQLGHEVILCEKNDRLGGILRCESQVPFKARLEKYLDAQEKRVFTAGIDVRLNTTVTPDYARSLNADAIIASLGSTAAKPPIPGIDNANVLAAEALYRDPALAGNRIVILGGGLVGLELAIFMTTLNKRAEVIELLPELNLDPFGMHTMAITQKLAELNITPHLSTRATEITPSGVKCVNDSGEHFYEADTVVYATGQHPLRTDAFALSDCAPEFHQIGDCVTPRNILAATQSAWTVARGLGRGDGDAGDAGNASF